MLPSPSWRAVIQVGETPSSYPAWRNIAAAAVRDGDLHGAISAYRQAERRAPAGDKAEIANRLGWLTKETGDTDAARRYFARGRGDDVDAVGDHGPHRRDGHRVAHGHPVDGGPVPLRRLPARQAGRGRGRVLAAVDRHAAPRQPANRASSAIARAPGLQHVRAVPVRADRRALVRARSGSCCSTCCAPPAARSRASSSAATCRRSAHRARSSGCSGCCSPRTASTARSTDRAGCWCGQLGMLILVNIVFGFAIPNIDNAAHLGGLATGLWIGAVVAADAGLDRGAAVAASGQHRGSFATMPVVSCPFLAIGGGRAGRRARVRRRDAAVRALAGGRSADVRDAARTAAASAARRRRASRGDPRRLLSSCQAEHGLEPLTDGGWPLGSG